MKPNAWHVIRKTTRRGTGSGQGADDRMNPDDRAPTLTTFGSCDHPGCHWVGLAHADTDTGRQAAVRDEADHRNATGHEAVSV